MLKLIWIILSKETSDNLRDRRSVGNALGTVLFNPIFYIFLFGFMNSSLQERAEAPVHLPIIGAENAPNLVDFLEQNDVIVLPPPNGDAEEAIRSGEYELVLQIPDSYGEQFRAGESAELELLSDESNQGASVSFVRVRRVIQAYGRQVGALRLVSRGLSPDLISPISVVEVDVSNDTQGESGFVLNLLPVIMMTAAFFGGFFLLVDMTAGERERDSLEPLLMNPVPRQAIVLGKFAAGFIFTTIATILSTVLFITLLTTPAIQDWTNLRLSLDASVVVNAIIIILPVIFMAVAIEMLLASYAKSFKEAQTYVQIVALIGFIPSVFLSVLPIRPGSWTMYVPTISQLYMIQGLSRGEVPLPLDFLIGAGVTVLVGAVALYMSLRLYQTERIILG